MPKQDSLAVLGLKNFLDDRYMYRGNLRIGGYKTFTQAVDADMTDVQIADIFKVKQNTAWKWRQRYNKEKEA